MIVPTGNAFFATSTFGPIGTAAGAAAACCAPAPANMFLAMIAVITAMTRAPTSRATFFTSMARPPPLNGPSEWCQTSGKMVKKPLVENRPEDAERSKGDCHAIRNLRTPLATLGAVPGDDDEGQNPAGK